MAKAGGRRAASRNLLSAWFGVRFAGKTVREYVDILKLHLIILLPLPILVLVFLTCLVFSYPFSKALASLFAWPLLVLGVFVFMFAAGLFVVAGLGWLLHVFLGALITFLAASGSFHAGHKAVREHGGSLSTTVVVGFLMGLAMAEYLYIMIALGVTSLAFLYGGQQSSVEVGNFVGLVVHWFTREVVEIPAVVWLLVGLVFLNVVSAVVGGFIAKLVRG